MKFYEKYPKAEINDEFFEDGDSVFKSNVLAPCAVCFVADKQAVMTSFYSIAFEGMPVCSEECLAKMWADFIEADQEANRKYGPPTY